jgi:hypothetical protein
MYTAHGTFLTLTQKLILFNIFTDNSTDYHQNLELKQHFGGPIFKDDRKLSTALTQWLVTQAMVLCMTGNKKALPITE